MKVTTGGRTTHAHSRRHAQGNRQLEEEQHARMGGIPNVGRVRVLVIHCKWLKSPIYINRDIQVSYRVWLSFCISSAFVISYHSYV
jgi:hypothetical protein